MTTNEHNDPLDARLDTLLAARSVAPRKDFENDIIAAINAGAGDALDSQIDERLALRPVLTRPERTEKFLAGVLRDEKHVIRFRRMFAWAGTGLTAAFVGFFAMTTFVPEIATTDTESLVAHAMARDPELADLLKNDAVPATPAQRTHKNDTISEAAALGNGINDNALAWLETLTQS